jgi:hypothetical protein
MAIRRGSNSRRSSEGDVALVQMQIAAQVRNQRWHDFLCNKRDELQARLRQQGYSQDQDVGVGRYGPVPDVEEGTHNTGSPAASIRWGSTAPDVPEDDDALEAAYLASDDLPGDYERDFGEDDEGVRAGSPSGDIPDQTAATSPGAENDI